MSAAALSAALGFPVTPLTLLGMQPFVPSWGSLPSVTYLARSTPIAIPPLTLPNLFNLTKVNGQCLVFL